MSGNVTVIDIVAQVTDETASGARSAEKNVSKLEKAMKSVQQRINDMRGKSKLEIAASLKDMASSGLQKIAEKGKSLAGKAWTVTMKLKDLVTAPFRGIARMLSNPIVQIATIAGVSLGVKDTIDTYKSFQQGMANVKAISNASAKDMTALTASAKELGETTMFSASQAAEAMENLAMAGWEAENIIKGMPGLLDLAAAGSVDLATASDVVSSAIAQFKLEADQAGKVADILAATATNSKTDVAGLGESLKYAGTVAAQLGYDIEDVALAIGTMGNYSIDGTSAGIALRTGLLRLAKQEGMTEEETNAMAEAARKLGISLKKDDGSMKSLKSLLVDMRKGFAGISDETERAALANALFGMNASSGMLTLMDTSEEGEKRFNDLAEAIENSKDAASRMANIKMDTLQGSMYYLQSAAEGAKNEIGEKLEPYLRGFIDWLTSKMPAIKTVALDAMDFLGAKIQSVQKKIEEMTQSNAWKGATTLWDKIKVAWNKIIAEPFEEWWNSSGRAWLSEKANGVGKFMGNFLKTGLLTLLGVDVGEVLNEGMAVGKSFMDGFLEGFDANKVLEGVKKVFKSIVADVGSGSSTSGLSAALLGIGALKIGSAGVSLIKGGKTIVGGVKGIAGAIKGVGAAGAAAGAGATRTAVMGSMLGGAGAAGAGAGSTILGALAPVGVVAAAIGAAAIGMSINSKRLNEAAKEFIDSQLFNNGLPKLTEYTAALKANNAETYRLAMRINKTASELETIQEEMQDAAKSVNFYSTSLRENGVLSQQEAKNMYEPFNQLCNSLKNDFEVRYNSVFEAFKDAAGKVATSLGADVATISATLDKFKEKYTGIINDSQTKVNSYLEKQASGEQLSGEELADLQKELENISAYANSQKTASQYDFEQMRDKIGRMDIGANQEKAQSDLAELSNYASSYAKELSEAAKNIDLQYENLRGGLKTALERGGMSQAEYNEFSKATDMAQAITDKAFDNKLKELDLEMKNVSASVLNQIHRAIASSVDERLNDDSAWFSKEAFFGIFTDDPYGEFYKSAQKNYQDIIGEVNAFPDIFGGITWKIPVRIENTIAEMEKNAPNNTTDDSLSNSVPEVQIDPGNRLTGGGTHHGGGGGRARANGGILRSPEISLVAEDGAEAIIPLSGKRRERGLALWQEAGRMLGVHEYAEGGIVGTIPPIGFSNSGGSSTNITVELGGIEIGGFNISVDGSTSPDEIIEIIRSNITNLSDEIANELAEKLQAVFANMPLKATG